MKLINNVRQKIAARSRRNVAIRELQRLSNRDLDDIGIHRYEIADVIDKKITRNVA